MRSGVSFPSFAKDATYAMVTGAAAAGYPVQNLSSLYNIRTVFQASASGNIAFTFLFSATRAIQLLTLLHHNASVAETIRIQLYSDAGLSVQVFDSGVIPLFPTGSAPSTLYPQNFPYLLNAPTNCRGGKITLASNSVAWVVGALELSGWWEWDDVAVPRQIGIKSNDVVAPQPFGVEHVMAQFSPRTIRADRTTTDQSENLTTALDFQLEKKTNNPFVWCWDIADATTYPRECVLVRNASLSPPRQNANPVGSQSVDLIEHLR